ncbi:MAG: hypothetical protein AAFN78_14205 [Pseudomonadota bacterium]
MSYKTVRGKLRSLKQTDSDPAANADQAKPHTLRKVLLIAAAGLLAFMAASTATAS